MIIGQDPYFKVNQAHGICFSVKKGVAVPPSLRTIYKVGVLTILHWADGSFCVTTDVSLLSSKLKGTRK